MISDDDGKHMLAMYHDHKCILCGNEIQPHKHPSMGRPIICQRCRWKDRYKKEKPRKRQSKYTSARHTWKRVD